MYIFPELEELLRELVERHRFKVERLRDTDGRLLGGEWLFPCNTGAMMYQYDAHAWTVDRLSTPRHNRLIREFGSAMTFLGHPVEIIGRVGATCEESRGGRRTRLRYRERLFRTTDSALVCRRSDRAVTSEDAACPFCDVTRPSSTLDEQAYSRGYWLPRN